MMKSEQETEDLIFCYTEHQPETLVMLYSPERVMDKMLRPPDQQHVVWVIPKVEEQLADRIEQLQAKTEIKVSAFPTLFEAKQFLLQNTEAKKVMVVAPPELTSDIHILNRRRQVGSLIVYPSELDEALYYKQSLENE